MKEHQKIRFRIEHVDPMGQGVDRHLGPITFIPKTLPQETGTARLVKQTRGVRFAHLDVLETESPERIAPACTHFSQCSGCDYLHTSYEAEQKMKTAAFETVFSKHDIDKSFFHFAKSRLSYRNRVQLHYDRRAGKLGFMQERSNRIVEVPNCLIGLPPIQAKLKALYDGSSWKTLTQGKGSKGHIELYFRDGRIQETINGPYSEGGFSQVNPAMNEILRGLVNHLVTTHFDTALPILDLFSGDGNLVKDQADSYEITHIDSFPQSIPNFLQLDLFREKDLSRLPIAARREANLVIDPPRSGFRNIRDWTGFFSVPCLVYVSCNPMTLSRDLHALSDQYAIRELHLVDLFPSTKHFECVALCQKR
jgi:23S rRNA (uracil1939-C5)-methyltransferase